MASTVFCVVCVLASPIEAATVALGTSIDDPNNYATFSGVTLQSVTLGGQTFATSSMINIVMTGFTGTSASTVLVPDTGQTVGSAYSLDAAQRRALIETDWRGDTGLINPGTATSAYQANFAQPLINGPGIDLLFFELNTALTPVDGVRLRINGVTLDITGPTSYGDTGVAASSADVMELPAAPADLNAVLTGSLTVAADSINQIVVGIGLDLSDFGVSAFGSVNSFALESLSSAATVDPVIIAGVIPEPSSVGLAALGFLAALRAVRRRCAR